MGFFDDPNMAALAAAAGAFGQGAMPTRVPVPFGAIAGQAAQSAFQGAGQAQKYQAEQTQNQMGQLNLERAKAMQPYILDQFRQQMQPAANANLPNAPVAPQVGEKPINNPGNLRPIGSSTGFMQYPTPQGGDAALTQDLFLKLDGKSPAMQGKSPTLRNIISTWSPSNENDTDSLVKNAAQRTGLDPDAPLGLQHLPLVKLAIIQQEQGGTGQQAAQAELPEIAALRQSIQAAQQQKLFAPPEKWPEIDASIANATAKLAELSPNVAGAKTTAVQKAEAATTAEKKQQEKQGENLAEAQKTYEVALSNLPRALERFQEIRDAAPFASAGGWGVDEHGDGIKPDFARTSIGQMIEPKTAKANQTISQAINQGILPEMAPQLAGMRPNKFMESLVAGATGVNMADPADVKVHAVNGLERQYIANLKASAAQRRSLGDQTAPSEADIDKMVYPTPDAVGLALKNGAITRDQAKQLLIELHGFKS